MLTKIRLDFGTEQSPTAVTLSQINAIFDTIHDEGVATVYSGHISLATGSITDAQAFELGANGITYHGDITAVSYDVNASATSVNEGGKVAFTATNGVPASALLVEVAGVTDATGITAQQIQSHVRIDGNEVYFDKVGTGSTWTATVLLDVKARFSQAAPKRISVSVQGIVELTGISLSGDDAVDILYPADHVDKTYTIVYQPANFNTEVGMPNVTCSNAQAQVISTTRNTFTVRYTGSEAYGNTIRCTVGGFTAELPVSVTRTIIPEITIEGDAEFTAINGNGSADYQFKYTPEDYNVEVELTSVVSSNADVKVSNKSLTGFTLSTTGITSGLGTTIVATFSVNGQTVTVNKAVNVKFINATITATEKAQIEAVDLGLPSGTLWANMNVGASSPEGYGKYFMWGEVEGNDCADGTTGGRTYNQNAYDALGLNAITTDLDLAHDAANHHMGGDWHMPTKEQFRELYDNTDSVWTSMNGVSGRKFTSKQDSSKWIFVPAAGYCNGSSFGYRGDLVRCWSASFSSSSIALNLNASSSDVYPQDRSNRYGGFSVRGVTTTPDQSTFKKVFTVATTNLTDPVITAAFRDASSYDIAISGNEVTVTRADMSTVEENTLIITATDADGIAITTEVFISNKIEPTITIEGDAEFTAKNGDGSADYTFGFNPDNYNVPVTLISVVSSNADVKASNKSLTGFTLSTNGITAGLGTTITATFNVDGASKSITKHVDVKYEEVYELGAVDLGLPSGTKWANMNVGADTPYGYGKYFMWGEVVGNDCADGTTGGREYTEAAYNALGLNAISANLDLVHDAANHHMGGDWHIPTKEQFQELYDNTDSIWTSMNDVYGRKFTSKQDSSKWIFIPAAGYCRNSSLSYRGSDVRCWSASLSSSSNAYYLYASSSDVYPQRNYARYYGCSVRGVL